MTFFKKTTTSSSWFMSKLLQTLRMEVRELEI